jgi:hypothetical protein
LLSKRQYQTYRGDIKINIPPETKIAYKMLAPEVGIPWYYFSGLILSASIAAIVILQKHGR